MRPTSIFIPRNVGGLIARLAKTDDGGAEVVGWLDGAWRPIDFPAGEVLAAPVVTNAALAELGILDVSTKLSL